MSQVEELEKLYAKTKEYKIPKEPKEGQQQVTISITPLGLDEMGLIGMKEDSPMSEIVKNCKKLFAISFGVEESVIVNPKGKISFEYFQDLMDAIMDANNFSEADKKKTGIKRFMEIQQKKMMEQQKRKELSDQKPAG